MKKEIVLRSDFLNQIPRSEAHVPSTLVDALLLARGQDGAPNYALNTLHKPVDLRDIDTAVDLFVTALELGHKILIVGDFDADGATSTAVLIRCLKSFGHSNVSYLVPNRFEFGYGLTPEIVEIALEQKPDLIVTVDNGIASIEGVALANKFGTKVLVTDHHLPGETLPEAAAIVNPNQHECDFPSKNLAGVGVIFYVMLALRSGLREHGWFTKKNLAEPNLADFLDLVALGTVADVVPLDTNNRVLVAQGLKRIRAGHCCEGIKALLKIANRDYQSISETDFGFAIGPRLNAAGRLDDMSIGIRCLLSDDYYEALEIAQQLDDFNQERKAIEASMQVDAVKDLSSVFDDIKPDAHSAISIYKDDWHQGVVGILASRIKDKYHRPTIAFANATDTEIKGSGRSVSGLHLRDVLAEIEAMHPGLMTKFGGHAMAAGVSIPIENYQRFAKVFDQTTAKYMTDEMRRPIVLSDGSLVREQFTMEHAQQVQSAGPWGQGFPEPRFSGVFRIVDQRLVGQKHLKLMLNPDSFSDVLVDAIAFNVDLGVWPSSEASELKAVYKLDVNVFRGRKSLQLIIDYLEPV